MQRAILSLLMISAAVGIILSIRSTWAKPQVEVGTIIKKDIVNSGETDSEPAYSIKLVLCKNGSISSYRFHNHEVFDKLIPGMIVKFETEGYGSKQILRFLEN